MSRLTSDEVAGWIRTLIPYLEKPVCISDADFKSDMLKVNPGIIVSYDSDLRPSAQMTLIEQTENLKILADLYKTVLNSEVQNEANL